MDELRTLIVRKLGDNLYEWAPELNEIPSIFHKSADGTSVMCPILPAIIYLLLTYPLRTHQARWLDSAELDELEYDFATAAFHPNERGIRGRQLGVLHCEDFYQKARDLKLEFQVAVNKTLLKDRHGSAYTIPFVDPAVVWVIQQVLQYQEKHGAPPRLVRESDEPVGRLKRNQALAAFYPEICPLFRYRRQASFYPPSHQQITYFWGSFCAIFDRKNAKWRDPNTGKVQQRPGMPLMSKRYAHRGPAGLKEYNWDIPLYDLHSLRVAGVSNLLDAGIPLAMVAAIAGHHSLAMTMHYYKADKEVLRLTLERAFQNSDSNGVIDSVNAQLRDLKDASWAVGTPEGLAMLQRARGTGLYTINISGICPAADCKTGLLPELQNGSGRNVPGSRCALCRFHITGTPFRLGLIYDFNCLLHMILAKAERQAEIRRALIEAEDRGRIGDVHRLRGEDDRLDQEAALDLKELAQLHRLIDECKDKSDSGTSAQKNVQLFVQEDMRLELEIDEVSHFQQLKSLLDVAIKVGPTRHLAPQIAELELRDMLLSLLRRNGIQDYFAGISKADARRSTLQLANLLELLVPEEDQRNALFDGSLWIEELPGVEAEIRKHIEASGQPTSRGACTESQILIGTTAKPQSMRTAIGRKARNVVQ
jgi:hypothetical protein